jgi:hypothetical protein
MHVGSNCTHTMCSHHALLLILDDRLYLAPLEKDIQVRTLFSAQNTPPTRTFMLNCVM